MAQHKKLRVIQYGCGKMGVVFLRYLYEQGHEIVGAIDTNPDVVGKDVATLVGVDAPMGVIVSDDADAVFEQAQADVAIIAIASLMTDMEPHFARAARYGVNAISTCEEAFYPFTTSKDITDALDAAAKEKGITLTGSGYQDVFWGNLMTTLAGATHKITRIKGTSSYNVEDYGIALAQVHGAGLSMEDFEKDIAQNDSLPSYMWNSSQWLCDALGLTITAISQKLVPTTHTADLVSSTLGMTVPAGHATGMNAIVTVQTAEGVEIVAECIGKVYAPEDVDTNDWTIEGEPDTSVLIHQPKTVELTCATIVNRLQDVVDAQPGFVPTSRMPIARYRGVTRTV